MSDEQEPQSTPEAMDVTLVQDAEGRFLMAPLFNRAILAHTDPDQAETAAQSFAGRKQAWTLVPSAVRAAEQAELVLLREAFHLACEDGGDPEDLLAEARGYLEARKGRER